MKVAFIGLGIMGSRMAANILKNGHKLTVYNRTRKKADALGKSLGIPAERIADTLIGGPVAAPFLAAKR